jgi:hypothetical protein
MYSLSFVIRALNWQASTTRLSLLSLIAAELQRHPGWVRSGA